MKKSLHCASVGVFILMLSCSPHGSVLTSERTDDGIGIKEDSKSVLFYQMKPKSVDGKFERTNYIHPLYSLDGNVITEDFPQDHPHHHGIYSAWHQIMLNGRQVADGWVSDNISFEVVRTITSAQPKNISLNSEVFWKLSSGPHADERIVREDLEITVHRSDDRFRIIDYDMRLTPLVDSVMIGGSDDEKGYGGFSLRLKLPEDISFSGRMGEVQPQVVSVVAGPWIDFAGSFDGNSASRSGVVVLCHPSNPGSPHPWILRREKSMQNPAWPGRLPILLGKDGINLRYRLIVHKGLERDTIEKLYSRYAR